VKKRNQRDEIKYHRRGEIKAAKKIAKKEKHQRNNKEEICEISK